ncbi:shikimate dehydrogenase [Pseudactinotalea sp.]|uniref:shikimate dehydrogenase n=1 Tax=Pseudactinotalea sp. TaxID=1926260 RepID=UPI003B3AE68F
MPRIAALLGTPLRRRHSPAMHNAAFAALGIDGEYLLRDIPEAALEAEVERARAEHWYGFQITAPHKRAIMPLLDEIEPDALAIGALNCVEVTETGRLVGFNTDVIGFMAGAEHLMGGPVTGCRVVIAGTGGAARSAVYGIAQQAPAHLTVTGRSATHAAELAAELAPGVETAALALDDPLLAGELARAELFVNATSVGMLSPGPVIEVSLLGSSTAVYDVVYVPRSTALLEQARAAGNPCLNGEEMLIRQAAVTFQRWTGSSDPTPIMREAAEPLFAYPHARP